MPWNGNTSKVSKILIQAIFEFSVKYMLIAKSGSAIVGGGCFVVHDKISDHLIITCPHALVIDQFLKSVSSNQSCYDFYADRRLF